ncbi:MAG: hypothetical protein GY913_01390 [Proteobacteria bacterium]|nr:hypothetical protein [Pseudomonadota bacterium]MCP4915553.1 hypothetical protein [Pseudomonadota bacterium]
MVVTLDLPITLKTETGIAFGRVHRLDGRKQISLRTDRKLAVGEKMTLKMELPGATIPFTALIQIERTGGTAGGQRAYECIVAEVSDPDAERFDVWLETSASGGASTRPDLVVAELQEGFDMRMSSATDAQTNHTLKAIDATLGQESKSKDPYRFDDEENTDVTEGDTNAVLAALRKSLADRARRESDRPPPPTRPAPSQSVTTQPVAVAAPPEEDDGWLDDLGDGLQSLDLGIETGDESLDESDFDELLESGGVLEDIIEDDSDDDSFAELTGDGLAEDTFDELIDDDDEFEDDDVDDLRAPRFRDDSDVPLGRISDEVVEAIPEPEPVPAPQDDMPTLDMEPEELEEPEPPVSVDETPTIDFDEPTGALPDLDDVWIGDTAPIPDMSDEPEPAAPEPVAAAPEPEPPAVDEADEAAVSGPKVRTDGAAVTVTWKTREDFATSWEGGLKKKKLTLVTADPPPSGPVKLRLELHDGQVLALTARVKSTETSGFTLAVDLAFATKTKLKRAAAPA